MIALNKVTRVSFEDITHSYLLDGEVELMGVTTLMKKHGLSPDYSGISEDVLAKAAAKGSKVHKDIEDYCNGKEVVMTPALKAYISCGIKPIANEYLVTDYALVASSIDIVADAGNGKVNLIDIKTTSTLHHEALSWQLSIYAHLFRGLNPDVEIEELYGLHIKNGKAQMVKVREIDYTQIQDLFSCEVKGWLYEPPQETLPQATNDLLVSLSATASAVAMLKAQLKEAEQMQKDVEAAILAEMEKEGLKTLEGEDVKVTYVAASTRESVDKARLEADLPEIYEKYKKVSNVAPSIRVTIKKQ